MSWFKSSDSSTAEAGPNVFPVTSYQTGFGPLTAKDTEWSCNTSKGFQTENQVWYSILEDGSLMMVQVIWTYIGVFLIPSTSQINFKLYNPKTKKTVWKSISTSNFKGNGQSCSANEFQIKHLGNPDGQESYEITASLDKSVQISLTFVKPATAPGFKLGEGVNGGITNFGENDDAKRDGFVVHRFIPMMHSSGTAVIDGAIVDAKGDATFIHAMQGMMPTRVASRWNFGFFTSGGENPDGKLGSVRAIQMEFETTDDHGPKGQKSGRTKVNIGAIYASHLSPTPIIITGQTHTPSTSTPFPTASKDISSTTHLSAKVDKDTSYSAPGGIEFKWESDRRDGQGRASGKILVEKMGDVVGEGGLIEKVDFLAQVPSLLKKALSATIGIKPFIYQYLNPATLEVTLDDEVIPVKGYLFNEATFLCD